MTFLDWLYLLLTLYEAAVVASTLSSWIPESQDYAIVQWLNRISDPYLRSFRGRLPLIEGSIDASPILALFLLHWLRNLLIL